MTRPTRISVSPASPAEPAGAAAARTRGRFARVLRDLGLAAAGACLASLIGLTVANTVPEGDRLHLQLSHVAPVDSAQFRRDASVLVGTRVTEGDRIEDLQNGHAYFPAMLADIRGAQHTIDLESYILRPGRIAQAFVAALSERARAGVKVHVLVDWVGSRGNDADAQRLRAAGVEFRFYHPPSELTRLNRRTHRKLLIVDGAVAYTGGMGIDDAWLGDADTPRRKRDMMFRMQGPVVNQLQSVFEQHWIATGGRALVGPVYAPPPAPERGGVAVQTFASAASGDQHKTRRMFLLAIAGARQSIDLQASYFVPDQASSEALLAALRRGVRVRILVEGDHVDGHMVGDASRTTWGPFLAAGAQIYRYGPSLFHSKLMVVDHYLTLAGSANFDNRSFYLNAEANIAVYDGAFARRMTDVFDRDLRVSAPVTLAQWRERPWSQRLVDGFYANFASQL